MTWSVNVTKAFHTVRPEKESTYYGPYVMLLYELFPPCDGYMVCPQHQVEAKNDSVDLVMAYIVENNSHVVFFIEVKSPGDIRNPSTRAKADNQMRQRYRELYFDINYVLHSASALGTKLCFYKVGPPDAYIEPKEIERDLRHVNDIAPRSRWNLDILEPEGEAALRAIALEITQIVSTW